MDDTIPRNSKRVDGLKGASSIAISDDGRWVYVAAPEDGKISIFRRGESVTARMEFIGTLNYTGAHTVQLTDDDFGQIYLLALGSKTNEFATWRRNPDGSISDRSPIIQRVDGLGKGADILGTVRAVELPPPRIIVTETDGSTIVSETGVPTDSFTVQLSREPDSDVVVCYDAYQNGTMPDITFSIPPNAFPNELIFTSADWNQAQRVDVIGLDNMAETPDRVATVYFTVDDALSSDEYDGQTEELDVTVMDDSDTGMVFTVNTELDVVDGSDEFLSLREAIIAANATPEGDTITFAPSLNGVPIMLSRAGRLEDGADTGDLDVTDKLAIIGNGARETIIDGGGIDRVFHNLSSVLLQIEGVTIQNGEATDGFDGADAFGGGIWNQFGELKINASTITDNRAIGPDGAGTAENGGFAGGGGILSFGMTTITNSTISSNLAEGGMGGPSDSGSFIRAGDGGDAYGGGIYQEGSARIQNSTLSGNRVIGGDDGNASYPLNANGGDTRGGGIYAYSGSIDLISSTIASNDGTPGEGGQGGSDGGEDGTSQGGGLFVNDSLATVSSFSSIFADNTVGPNTSGFAKDDEGPDVFGTLSRADFTLIANPASSTIAAGSENLLNVNPQLLGLADNGGPTDTHPLAATSLAIDAGGFTSTTADQRGFARIFGPAPDIGAVENFETTFVVNTALDVIDPADGLTSLREAVIAANDSPGQDTITFDPRLDGTTITLSRPNPVGDAKDVSETGDLDVTDHLIVQGNGASRTIIDAGGIDRAWHIIGVDAMFSGITVQGGRATDGTGTGGVTILASAEGGAFLNDRGQLTIRDSVLTGNTAESFAGGQAFGGAIRNKGISVSFPPGPVIFEPGFLLVENTTISGNQAIGGQGELGMPGETAHGGGISDNGFGRVTIDRSTISGNEAAGGDGGNGLAAIGSDPGGAAGIGGAAYGGGVSATVLLVTNSTISGNDANGGFGGEGGESEDGQAGDGGDGGLAQGAGVFAPLSALLEFTSVTVAGNTAFGGDGGGAGVSTGLGTDGLPGELGMSEGGGLFHSSGTVKAVSSIFGDNAADVAADVRVNFDADSVRNLVEDPDGVSGISDGDGNSNIVGVDPMLGPLQDNFGPTFTHDLLEDSPAIDAGENGNSSTDQRGFVRLFAARTDIGAVESSSSNLIVNTPLDVVDASDGLTSLREAVLAANANPGRDEIYFDSILDGVPIVLSIVNENGGEDLAATGDLDINDVSNGDLFIVGNGASQTIIDASGLDPDADGPLFGDRAIQVFGDNDLVISDVTIQGGNVDGDGGGIENFGGLTVFGSIIDNNRAIGFGGGIATSGPTGVFAPPPVGVAATANGSLSVSYTTISGNTSIGADGEDATTPSDDGLVGSRGRGGGIYGNYTSSVMVEHTTISGNSAIGGRGGTGGDGADGGAGGPGDGGGIFSRSNVQVTNSTLSGNRASGGQGGLAGSGGSPGLGGYARGGGLRLIRTTSSGRVTSTTITGNSAVGGQSGDLSTVNKSYAGGLSTSSITLTSTIIAGNTAEVAPDAIVSTGLVDSDNNLIQDAGDVAGINGPGNDNNITGVDPLLGPLAANGGETFTHELLAGSPAIDMGDNPLSISHDQRGLVTAPGAMPELYLREFPTDASDIGAFEVQPVPQDISYPELIVFIAGEEHVVRFSAINDQQGDETDRIAVQQPKDLELAPFDKDISRNDSDGGHETLFVASDTVIHTLEYTESRLGEGFRETGKIESIPNISTLSDIELIANDQYLVAASGDDQSAAIFLRNPALGSGIEFAHRVVQPQLGVDGIRIPTSIAALDRIDELGRLTSQALIASTPEEGSTTFGAVSPFNVNIDGLYDGVRRNIPDNGHLDAPIRVQGVLGNIDEIDVHAFVTHGNPADLTYHLVHNPGPDETTIELTEFAGKAGQLRTTLTGLSVTNPNAQWALRIVDGTQNNSGELIDWVLNVRTDVDSRLPTAMITGGNELSSTEFVFDGTDVGKTVRIVGAGTDGADLLTTITSVDQTNTSEDNKTKTATLADTVADGPVIAYLQDVGKIVASTIKVTQSVPTSPRPITDVNVSIDADGIDLSSTTISLIKDNIKVDLWTPATIAGLFTTEFGSQSENNLIRLFGNTYLTRVRFLAPGSNSTINVSVNARDVTVQLTPGATANQVAAAINSTFLPGSMFVGAEVDGSGSGIVAPTDFRQLVQSERTVNLQDLTFDEAFFASFYPLNNGPAIIGKSATQLRPEGVGRSRHQWDHDLG